MGLFDKELQQIKEVSKPFRDAYDRAGTQISRGLFGNVAGTYLGDVFYNLGEKEGLQVDDFSPEALKLMKEVVTKEGPGHIDFKDDDIIKKYAPKDFGSTMDHLFSPYGELRNMLGKVEITKDLKIRDEGYDWRATYGTDETEWLGGRGPEGLGFNTLGKAAWNLGGTREGVDKAKEFTLDLGLFSKNKKKKNFNTDLNVEF